jgi:AbiV family abortive infection protein
MDKENYEKGFRLTYENAHRLYKSAETLETNKEYSAISNSLMILAAEEAIKAYIIFTQHFFPEKATQDFNKFFEDHKHKLNAIRKIAVFRQIFQIFNEHLCDPIIENFDKSPEELAEIKSDGIENIVKCLNIEADSSKTYMATQNKWWQHAQTMKESGLYVGYNNGNWATPLSIKKEHYAKTKKYVSEFMECVDALYNLDLTDENVMNMLNSLQTKVMDKKMKDDQS